MLKAEKKVSFFDTISPFVKISPKSRSALLSVMQKNHYAKGHVLVPLGGICRYVYYIEKGLSRTFYIKDGKDITEKFCTENSFTCSMPASITNVPDNRQIELLEPSIIWSMPYTELEKLYDDYHDIERMGRFVVTNELIHMHQRLSDLQFRSAEERYNNLLQKNPDLLQRVSLGLISSYLGITQETLSRIRSRV